MAVENKGSYGPIAVKGVVATTGGAILALPNPEGVDLIITRAILNITTKSTSAAALAIGIAANATTSAKTLLDAVAGGAAGVVDNISNGGDAGLPANLWKANEFLTITGAADSTGMVANLYLKYIHV